MHTDYLDGCVAFARQAAQAGKRCALRLWNLDGESPQGANSCNDVILRRLEETFPRPWKEGWQGTTLAPRVYLEWGERFEWPDLNADDQGQSGFCQGLRDHDFIKMASREVNYLAEPGDVLVGDAGGMTEMSSMGGQSFVSAKIRGLEGVVIDGAVRDVGEIRKYGVPTWCRGATPKTGKCRIEAMEINGPVVLAGIQINPGDLIIADDSGICAVPPQHAAYVLKKCQEILPDEEVMRELIERDAPISEIKKLFRKRYTDDDNPNTQK